jgi:hypothetical protein
MNRYHHLKVTLEPNLRVVEDFGGAVEWVVVNYNSRDGMGEGLRAYGGLIESGHLSYYHTTEFQFYSSPHSKNLAHLLAGGAYVVNLDADTFLSAEGVARILQIFEEHPDAVMRGLTGLVGIKKTHFLSLGGYDEDFTGWGFDDDDFVSRARRAGHRYFEEESLVHRLEHDDEERVSNFDPALLERLGVKDASQMRWEMQRRNYNLSTANAQDGRVKANENRVVGKALVTRNFSDELTRVGYEVA